jgi:uncharacterized protein YjdB
MNRAFHSSRSRAQKAARIPSLRRVARAGALLATVIVLAISFAACSSSNNSTLTSIAVTPATASIAVGATQQYVATGTYSDGSMKTLTTETWNSSTTATATISTSGLATGLALGTTTITATCGTVTSPGVTLTVSNATLESIAVTPTNASIAVGATQQYTATGTYSDGTMSVLTNATWTSSNIAVATIGSTTGLATGVGVGTTTITAASGTVTSPGVTLTVTSTGGNNSLLNGQYALLLSGADQADGFAFNYSFAASITADGLGDITTGEIDFADGNFMTANVTPITGTYTIGSDGRGSITLTTLNTYFGVGGITTLGVSMTSGTGGLIIEEDSFATGSGTLTMQGAGSTSQSSITGNYVFAFSGVDESNTDSIIDVAGDFTANGAGGVFSNGVQDVVTGGVTNLNGAIAGTYTAPDGNGRGTATLQSGDYAYYSAGGTTLYFIEIDEKTLLSGSVVTQASSPSLPAGSYAFAGGGTDYLDGGVPLAVGGLFTSDGAINITSGTLDFNDDGSGTEFSDIAISGTWTVGSNGRGVMTLSDPDYPITEFSFYPTANNGIFLLEIDGSGFQSSEIAMLQSGTFSDASLTGPYAVNFSGVPLNTGALEHDVVGELTSNGAGTLTGLADVNSFGGTGGVMTGGAFTGTYTVSDASGRFSGFLTDSESSQTVEFYTVDAATPNTALFISLDTFQVNSGVMETQMFDSVPPQGGHAVRVLPAHFIGPRALLHHAAHEDGTRVPVK